MSALWAPVTGWKEPARQADSNAPSLRSVPLRRERMARVPFLIFLVGIFGVGMIGLLLLNTTLQNQAFESRALNRQATELAYAQGELESQIDALAAPQELARKASALGMRANSKPAFLVVPTGKVIGRPEPVTGSEVPSLVVKSPQELAAEKAAEKAQAKARAAQQAAAAEAKAAEAKRRAEQDAVEARNRADRQAAKNKAAQQEAERKKATEKKPSPSGDPTTSGDQEGRG
ncbi:MAG TPA: hypothetical protein VFP89_14785 [Propionibacteriaceae bacterium]|nr:hypothetical protein [Propionibacteriaceae bacterium]